MSGAKNPSHYVSNIKPPAAAIPELIPNEDAHRPERILLAAWELHQTQGEFTLEDLVVMAWLRSKKDFGLRGYEDDHPDNKCIEATLYGKDRGLIHLCFLEKRYTEAQSTAARRYHKPFKKNLALTERGKRMVEGIISQDKKVAGNAPVIRIPRPNKKLPKGANKVLERIFTSKFWMLGRSPKECRFAEACEVLGITEEEVLDKAGLKAKIDDTKAALSVMLGEMADYETRVGDAISPNDAQAALRIVEIFEEKYKPHFRLITERKEKSK